MRLRFLSEADAERAERVLRKLAQHDLRNWALAGGFAFEFHSLNLGLDCRARALNDLDFITGTFIGIPETLSQDFLFRHVHPFAPPGKIMLQLIDRDAALRIDVFRASIDTMNRVALQMASLEDLVARAARFLFDLAQGVPVARKHASDYLRAIEHVDSEKMEVAWQDHRKAMHPTTFQEARSALEHLIPASADLLATPRYSQDPNEVCPRCAPTRAFQLADPRVVLSLLGYC